MQVKALQVRTRAASCMPCIHSHSTIVLDRIASCMRIVCTELRVEYTEHGGTGCGGCAFYTMPKVCITCTSKLYSNPSLVVNIMWMGR